MLAKLQARLKELAGELEALEKKDTLTADDLKAMKDKTTEVEKTLEDIATLQASEAARARAAVPADAPAGTTVAAQPKKDLTPVEKVGIVISGMVTALNENGVRGFRPTMKAIEDNGYAAVAREFEPAQKRTMISSNASAGGILLPEDMSNDIIDILRPNTTFLQGMPEVIPMPNGTYKLPAAASGATAAYRGEAKPAAVTTPSFKAINMSAKLLAGIVPISNQLIRWSGPNVGAWAQGDLATSMGTVMDYNAFFGDGLEDTPLGILNIPGVYTTAATNSTAPTYSQVDADARKLLNAIENANVPLVRVEWRMAPRVMNFLADMRDGNGNPIYPTLQGENPIWKGYRVRKTTQFPINGGGTTDESTISLIAFGHVMFGDCLRMQLAISDVATVKNGSQTINAFQDGVTVLRAESEHDFDCRYVEAIASLTAVRWGA
ncbi:putative Phage major capsid protein, HK97 family [Mesorhizobium plurifarium]|uniref:Putative Phage major capsid protein, HK97 family n=1 Tax=Mesorhizobium plurifarium TaxID=69974 RepID=A0A090E9R7_MESPL|nr:putative Phage major capsid protein, HK97 family [Mesorhizobium plurifarium]